MNVSSPIDPHLTRLKYEQRTEIWPSSDLWHSYTARRLERIVERLGKPGEFTGKRVLNLGSGGKSYGFESCELTSVDIAMSLVSTQPQPVVGTAEELPFADNTFDLVLCVGSVINYCDAVALCREISRVLKHEGKAILEFESSNSAEYIRRPQYKLDAVGVRVPYQGQLESIWLYSPSYLRALLSAVGMQVNQDLGFHTVTTIAYRLFGTESSAMIFSELDTFGFVSRLLRSFACNRIFLAQKQT